MGKVIMFDIDGVLADFVYGFTALAKDMYPAEGIRPYGTLVHPTWNFRRIISTAQEGACMAMLQRTARWWSTLPPLVTAEEVERIQALSWKHHVYYVTARQSATDHPVGEQTRAWLDSVGLARGHVVVTSRKGEIARALGAHYSLEDKVENAWCIHFLTSPELQRDGADRHQCKSYLINRIYNQAASDPEIGTAGVLRVDSLADYLDILEEAC